MSTGTRTVAELCRSKWWLPALGVVIGIAYFVVEAIAHNLQLGAEMFGIMVVFSVGVLLAGRSETVRGLRGDGRDERFAMLDLKATAFAGTVLITAVIVGFMVELARGHSGAPYMWLGVIAGVAYLVAVAWLRVRG